jgi:diguanylate cyclase (GGDEF)-like protein
MRSVSEDSPPTDHGAPVGDRNALSWSPREPLTRLIVGVALLGLVAFGALFSAVGPEPWPLLPWLGLTAACAVLVSFPYRVNRPGQSYFMDFDEILLVLSLLYVGPAATVAVLVVGYLLGATARHTSTSRLIFNAGARATGVTLALSLVSFLPTLGTHPWSYVIPATLAAAIYTTVNQLQVSYAIALLHRRRFLDEFKVACSELLRSWPVVVSYGLLVGVASESMPDVLVLAALPVALLVVASRFTQQRHDENVRMRGLYSAAQEMHDARTDEEVLRTLRRTVRATLGVDGAALRREPPFGEELGAWLPNRSTWVIVPAPATVATRKQDDAFLQALASLVDASMERATLVGELERQSLRDPLTNAFNRRHFHQALSLALEAADPTPGCLALLDIDHFKVINDTFGHEAGDRTLEELVSAVTATFRSDDILCRLGGDEFALILPGLTPQLAVDRLNDLRRRLSELRPGEPGHGPVGFRLSMGVAAFPEHGNDPEALLRSADQALYRAKREGRDRVIVSGNASAPSLGRD